MKAKYIIKATFKITGRGLVLGGYIEEGVIFPGDYIEFVAFAKTRKKKITAIEGLRKALDHTSNTGLLISCENEDEIDELRDWKPQNDMAIITKE